MGISTYMSDLLKLTKCEQTLQLRKDVANNPSLLYEPEVIQWLRDIVKCTTSEEIELWRRKVKNQ